MLCVRVRIRAYGRIEKKRAATKEKTAAAQGFIG